MDANATQATTDHVQPAPAQPADAGAAGVERRCFIRLAAAAALTGALTGRTALAAVPPGGIAAGEARAVAYGDPLRVTVRQATQEATMPPLGNGETPALQFQAYPGGTGALMEKLWRGSGGNPFERQVIDIEPWQGRPPATEEELAFLPVHRLAALLRERRITATELTGIYLERLKRLDPVLLCAATILEGPAREEAEQADAEIRTGRWRGPLHGVPWGVKDLFAVRNAPTTWGAREFADRVIDQDAEVVVRLRNAGAVLIAKLSTGEFALGDNWFRGRTRNPWNLEQGSSGSSAGPASATVAGCVGFAIGTETQGSIVSPAIRCGMSALRPTFGRVSRHGGMVLAWSMDKVGPMCRTIEDCALVFGAIHGSDEKDPATITAPFRFQRQPDLSRLRIGYASNPPEAFLDKLRELGADPTPMPDLPGGNSRAISVESAAAFDYHVGPALAAAEGDDSPVPGGNRFRTGRAVTALDYVQSQRRRYLLMQEMAIAMQGFDMFVTGSGEVTLTNQTGHPAVVLPFALREGDSPQPVCTTLIGALFADDLILSVAHAYQSATGWHRLHPRLG
jgi:Asp-tRNA(Asn)/Glu-tRNA(Gln) amidotransferase A subunit family amidase